jgi:aspartate carbamoyltransferase regulatory subunit
MELYHYLQLDKLDCEVALIKNAVSEKFGRKDIIKINERIDVNLDILAFIAPTITVNFIEHGEKVGKAHPRLPAKIVDIIKCKNPRCITSTEQELPHVFVLSDEEKGLYRCLYCDTKAK